MFREPVENEKYIIYPDGSVYSKYFKRKIKVHFIPTTGYTQFAMGNVRVSCHRLIAKTFIPNPLNLPQVGHKNNIKTDNRVDNLEWTTGKDNTIKAYADGLAKGPSGQKNGQSKLKDWQVKAIRVLNKMYPVIYSQGKLGKFYGVSQSVIYQIIHRKTWNHV